MQTSIKNHIRTKALQRKTSYVILNKIDVLGKKGVLVVRNKYKILIAVIIPIILISVFSVIMLPKVFSKGDSVIQSDYVYKDIKVHYNNSPTGTTATADIEVLLVDEFITSSSSIKAVLVLTTDNGDITKTCTFDKFTQTNRDATNLSYKTYKSTAKIVENDQTTTFFRLKEIKSVKYSENYTRYKDIQKLNYDELDDLKAEVVKYSTYNHDTKFMYIGLTVAGYGMLFVISVATITITAASCKAKNPTPTFASKFVVQEGTVAGENIIVCQYCNSNNNANAKKCTNCGAQLKRNKSKLDK